MPNDKVQREFNEPWVNENGLVLDECRHVMVAEAGDFTCSEAESDKIRDRIAACVNACAGLPTQELIGAKVLGLHYEVPRSPKSEFTA